MSLGLSVWCGSVIMFAFSTSYIVLAFSRLIIGAGRAGFGCLAQPIILDSAPHERRAIWIVIYYSSSPIGVAIRYIYGAQASNALGNWFYPFVVETFIMIPLVVVLLISYKDPKFYAKKEDGRKEKPTSQIMILAKNPLYVCLILGTAADSFTLTGLAFWVRFK